MYLYIYIYIMIMIIIIIIVIIIVIINIITIAGPRNGSHNFDVVHHIYGFCCVCVCS